MLDSVIALEYTEGVNLYDSLAINDSLATNGELRTQLYPTSQSSIAL
jgi:hypothetical protein